MRTKSLGGQFISSAELSNEDATETRRGIFDFHLAYLDIPGDDCNNDLGRGRLFMCNFNCTWQTTRVIHEFILMDDCNDLSSISVWEIIPEGIFPCD